MTTTSPDQHLMHESAAPSAAVASLLVRLDDPATAAALHDLLDHAELLALAVGTADGLLQRSETITSNLAEGIADLRSSVAGADGSAPGLAELTALLPALTRALPALQALLASGLVRPETIAALDTVSGALTTGLETSRDQRTRVGWRGVLAQLRDPATPRGLSVLLDVARSLGGR